MSPRSKLFAPPVINAVAKLSGKVNEMCIRDRVTASRCRRRTASRWPSRAVPAEGRARHAANPGTRCVIPGGERAIMHLGDPIDDTGDRFIRLVLAGHLPGQGELLFAGDPLFRPYPESA